MIRAIHFGVLVSICAATYPAWGHRATACDGTLTGTIQGDVVVERGKSCHLLSAVVTGKVVTKPGAILLDVGGSTVKGCVKAGNVDEVFFERSHFESSVKVSHVNSTVSSCFNTFERNFTIRESAADILLGGANCDTEDSTVPPDLIHGTLRVSENTGFVEVLGVVVDEDAIFQDNTRGVTLEVNVVGDDLLCRGNKPKAAAALNTVGDRNTCGG